MPLYGRELTLSTTPYDAGLGRVVSFKKAADFVGRAALSRASAHAPDRVLVGLILEGRRVGRHGQSVLTRGTDGRVGIITSGAPSPTLRRPIAMAYVDAGSAAPGTELDVDVRGRPEPAHVTPLPFYRRIR